MPATEPDGFPYPDAEDAANVPVDLQALADKLQEKYGAINLSNLTVPGGEADDGKIAIVENGVVKLKAVSGDVTISETGVVEIGAEKVGTLEITNKGVTTTKLNDEAVTLAKLAKALGLTEGYYADGSVTSRKFKPTHGVVTVTEGLSLSGSYQDIPGLKIDCSPAVKSKLKVWGGIGVSGSSLGRAHVTIKVDAGEDAPGGIFDEFGAQFNSEWLSSIACCWDVSLDPGAHTVKLRAKRAAGSGGSVGGGTRVLWMLVAE